MPSGLKNAPATAARVMNRVLAGLNYVICFVYFDDIIVFGRDQKEHDERLRMVLNRMRQFNVKIRKHKCDFSKSCVDYLGYNIGVTGISPSESNVATVWNFSEPSNVVELRRFYGLCSYFHRFICNFSEILHPSTQLLKQGVAWCWEDSRKRAFETLRNIIIEKPVLACYKTDGAIEVHTNACDYGIGAVMYQQQKDGQFKPVCYIFRTLSPAEKNYGITEKECLAIVWSLHCLRHYLYGRKFSVITDDCELCWFMTS